MLGAKCKAGEVGGISYRMARKKRLKELPDKMTGKDLVDQEIHESNLERQWFDGMDYVDRRDRQKHIKSRTLSRRGIENYEKIKWNN